MGQACPDLIEVVNSSLICSGLVIGETAPLEVTTIQDHLETLQFGLVLSPPLPTLPNYSQHHLATHP